LVQDVYADSFYDARDQAAVEAWIVAQLNRARRAIIASHRTSGATVEVPIAPRLGCHHRVGIAIPGLSAEGKVRHVLHRMDIERGRATTEVEVAILRGGGGAEDALTAPAAPSAAAIRSALPSGGSGGLDTHVGGVLGAPAYDEGWNGVTVNASNPYPGAAVYPVRCRIDVPAIELPSGTEPDVTQSAGYSVAARDDTWVIS
jgi:hypothetical protein